MKQTKENQHDHGAEAVAMDTFQKAFRKLETLEDPAKLRRAVRLEPAAETGTSVQKCCVNRS